MIEAVIFDMDGVLADTEYYYENRRKNFLLENGIPIPEGKFIGSNEKAIWEAIVPNDPVRRQEMLMAYREYRKARPTPYGKLTDPQAEPLMNALRSRGLKVAVASSSAAPDIMKMLTEGGLKGADGRQGHCGGGFPHRHCLRKGGRPEGAGTEAPPRRAAGPVRRRLHHHPADGCKGASGLRWKRSRTACAKT